MSAVLPDPLGLAGQPWAPMDAARAHTLAERLHRGRRDAGGGRLIEHVRRVAATVAPDARVVAWLHETLEHTSISEQSVLAERLSTRELRAIRLLTDVKLAHSNTSDLAHIEMLSRARGAGARPARGVKRADLGDRKRHPTVRANGWSPPYERAVAVLERAASRRRRGLSVDTGLSPGQAVGCWAQRTFAVPPRCRPAGRPALDDADDLVAEQLLERLGQEVVGGEGDQAAAPRPGRVPPA